MLSWIVPERTIYIRTGETLSHKTISPLAQLIAFFGVVGTTFSSIFLFSIVVLDKVGGPVEGIESDVMQAAYEHRIAALTEERDRLRLDLMDMAQRKRAAIDALDDQVAMTLANSALRTQLATDFARSSGLAEELRLQLGAALAERDIAEAETQRMTLEFASLVASEADLQSAVERLSYEVLDEANQVRDLVNAYESLETEVESFASEQMLMRQHQSRVYTRLETAVTAGLDTLEGVFKRAGTDVEALIGTMRESQTGQGGPEVTLSGVTLGNDAPFIPLNEGEAAKAPFFEDQQARVLYQELQRLNLMRSAFVSMPFAHPVPARHRQSSPFGLRRDPFTREIRQHNGVDFAARTGTPIAATADGVVVLAGTWGAYGKIVKIRHDFGYETLYAHLHRIRVRRGERVVRGERIGDMGSTGRSTGPHLHYEIRRDGRAVDPQNYLRAARDVL